MLSTSALYRQIRDDPNHYEEHKIVINDIVYTEESIAGFDTERTVFSGETLTIGAAAMGSINVTLRVQGVNSGTLSSQIPRMAKIEPFTRLCRMHNGSLQTSEWLPQGKFWTDQRDSAAWSVQLSLTGYDAMAFAEADYPSTSHAWPTTDLAVVQEIAQAINVDLDSATTAAMTAGYSIPLPGSYTMREVLGHIAAMYGGNFVMSKEGKLLLLTLNSLPEESNLLIDTNGNYITFGGVRIIV